MKVSASEAPNSLSIISIANPVSNGATSSCSFSSSFNVSKSNKSFLVDKIWPIFTNTGPKSSRALRSDMGNGVLEGISLIGDKSNLHINGSFESIYLSSLRYSPMKIILIARENIGSLISF